MQPDSNGPIPLTAEERERGLDIRWAWGDTQVQEKFPDEFVAVYRRRVVAHGHDLNAVLDEAVRVTGQPREQIALTSVQGPETLFLGH